MNNQECKIRPEIVNVNSDEPTFHPYSVKIIKCSSSCNNNNNPYAKWCVADIAIITRKKEVSAKTCQNLK